MSALFNGNGLDVCNLLRLTAMQANVFQQAANASPNKKRNVDAGNKLDRAVRKLTDRLESKVEPREFQNGCHTPENGLINSRPVSNASAIVENGMTNGHGPSHGANTGIFANNQVNLSPMDCVQMLRNLTAGMGANNATICSTFPVAENLSIKQEEG